MVEAPARSSRDQGSRRYHRAGAKRNAAAAAQWRAMGRAQAHLRVRREWLMARRHVTVEPISRLAIWARRMALFSLAAALLSIIIVRSGLLEIRPALATFAGALACAVIAIVLALAAFVVIWKDGLRGLGYAF